MTNTTEFKDIANFGMICRKVIHENTTGFILNEKPPPPRRFRGVYHSTNLNGQSLLRLLGWKRKNIGSIGDRLGSAFSAIDKNYCERKPEKQTVVKRLSTRLGVDQGTHDGIKKQIWFEVE